MEWGFSSCFRSLVTIRVRVRAEVREFRALSFCSFFRRSMGLREREKEREREKREKRERKRENKVGVKQIRARILIKVERESKAWQSLVWLYGGWTLRKSLTEPRGI